MLSVICVTCTQMCHVQCNTDFMFVQVSSPMELSVVVVVLVVL